MGQLKRDAILIEETRSLRVGQPTPPKCVFPLVYLHHQADADDSPVLGFRTETGFVSGFHSTCQPNCFAKTRYFALLSTPGNVIPSLFPII
jgi:hypothetical protein